MTGGALTMIMVILWVMGQVGFNGVIVGVVIDMLPILMIMAVSVIGSIQDKK